MKTSNVILAALIFNAIFFWAGVNLSASGILDRAQYKTDDWIPVECATASTKEALKSEQVVQCPEWEGDR